MKTTFFLRMLLLGFGGIVVGEMPASACGMCYENNSVLTWMEKIDRDGSWMAKSVVYTEISLAQVPDWVFDALTDLNPGATLIKAWAGSDGSFKVGYLLHGFKTYYAIFARW